MPRDLTNSENEEIPDEEIPQPQSMKKEIYNSLKYLGQRELILHYQTLRPDQKHAMQSNYHSVYL